MNKKIFYIVNDIHFFISHRLEIALESQRQGFDISIIFGSALNNNYKKNLGFKYFETSFRPLGVNFFFELLGFFQIIVLLFKHKPFIVHCISPKGILYGGIACKFLSINNVIIAISGFGYLFSNKKIKINNFGSILLSHLYKFLFGYALAHKSKKIIVQNQNDRNFIIRNHYANIKDVLLIPGSGVNLRNYNNSHYNSKLPIIILASRLIISKGIYEFLDAAEIVKKKYPNWEFLLFGALNKNHPDSIQFRRIQEKVGQGVIDYKGYVSNMTPWFRKSSIVCLPSYYREGLPKVLIEAAASYNAVITTNVPGCNEAILNGQTGDLINPRSSKDLSEKILLLIKDKNRLKKYQQQGRALAIKKFDLNDVVNTTILLYKSFY